MVILGYASLNHDASAAVVIDGKIRSAIESEKVTRSKHEVNPFPDRALRAALDAAGASLRDVDAIATNYDAGPFANRLYVPHLLRMIKARSFDAGIIANAIVIAGAHHRRMFGQLAERTLPPVVKVRHHRAHLAASFLCSGLDEAAVAVIDAAGELECTSLWHCAGRSVRKLRSMDLPADSLGTVYMLCTRHLGYAMLGDEYKVMGLAGCGRESARYRAFFSRLIQLDADGGYRVDPRLLGRVFDNGWKFPASTVTELGPERIPDQPIDANHADFAFELQRRLEEAILHVVRALRKETKARHLCLSGGVALNCVANGKILADAGFDSVFVPPAPHDSGTSLGAALHHAYYDLGGDRPQPLTCPYLGPAFCDDEIERELRRAKQQFVTLADPPRTAARALASGLVVGWFQGRTEFGPRALGNRSILADPRRGDMKNTVNRLVKERESYRPFAPAILEEEVGRFFGRVRRSPWMLFVDAVRPEVRDVIPAVVHADGTARPQTVAASDNPAFHALISHFHAITGVPVVLNTSFNVAGEPIVNTPVEALRCFHGSGLDAVAIGSFWLAKPNGPSFTPNA
jgi:carbamoyltransferase